ncbi:MAG: alkaline phosphatase family protein, partial [Pseudomonadota bacterium]
MRRLSFSVAAIALATSPALADGHSASEVSLTSEDLLAPYYAKLIGEVELPVAPGNVSLAPETTITRLAFGSCNHQLRPQGFWGQIA